MQLTFHIFVANGIFVWTSFFFTQCTICITIICSTIAWLFHTLPALQRFPIWSRHLKRINLLTRQFYFKTPLQLKEHNTHTLTVTIDKTWLQFVVTALTLSGSSSCLWLLYVLDLGWCHYFWKILLTVWNKIKTSSPIQTNQ